MCEGDMYQVLTSPESLNLLRYVEDERATLDRLYNHPHLERIVALGKHFVFFSRDEKILSILLDVSPYAPFHEWIEEPIQIVANEGFHDTYPEFLGFQEENRISLYKPSYQNVSTLVFTFFHEYGHWLHKQEKFTKCHLWDSYSKICQKKANSTSHLFEDFANGFAWFCTNPAFLRIDRRLDFDFFSNLVKNQSSKKRGEIWEDLGVSR